MKNIADTGILARIRKLAPQSAEHAAPFRTPEGVVSSYDRTRNVICTECRNSVTMQRVLAFYRGHYREAKSA
ncbi:DUF977 family protein [Salmonella enterica]|nr:DUF977 family protein [Salmonella enterica]EAQ7575795.1 DUF977 family protein [Salmonella enterica]EBR5574513.1 DUF977 family protein [Salmonella enterica]EFU5012747.1 DUF977 family protein [Salmonella enterica]EGG5466582.1 DUF977 family protein [Salmonella enterica]